MNEAVQAARDSLQSIIEKLEPIEKELLSFNVGFWGVNSESDKAAQKRLSTGLEYLRFALSGARDTLGSENNPETIIVNAFIYLDFFNEGRLALFPYATRRFGGKKSGGIRRKEADRQPFVDLYWKKVEADVPYLTARNECIDAAKLKGVNFPTSVPSLNKWFPKPKNIK
jgi:hypothetical protein